MPTSSIFDTFVIDSTEKLKILLQENTEGRKTPEIDIREKIRKGKEVLKNF